MNPLFYRAPAFIYGVAIWLGSLTALDKQWHYLLAAPLAALFYPGRSRLLLALLLFAAQYYAVTTRIVIPAATDQGVWHGTALFQPEAIILNKHHFGKQWSYTGTLLTMRTPNGNLIAKGIPCRIRLPSNRGQISSNQRYMITGTLTHCGHAYAFKPDPEAAWLTHSSQWSWAEARYSWKEAVKKWIDRQVPNKRSARFLAGAVTGNFDDAVMRKQMGRFGLQHVMAISGFHFAIVAAFLGAVLRALLPYRLALLLLCLLLTGYCFFLGSAPSISRAWLSLLFTLTGIIAQRRPYGLNCLGSALIAILIYDPFMVRNIGFQFSATVTAAILIFYPFANLLLEKWLQRHSLREMVEMNGWEQHAYCLLTAFRCSLGLTLSVNLVALPLCLYHFGTFPLLGFVHNLFFPFLISIAIVLLIISCCLAPLPLIGNAAFTITAAFTHYALNTTYNVPPSFDLLLTIPISEPLLVSYFFLLAAAGFLTLDFLQKRSSSRHDLLFV